MGTQECKICKAAFRESALTNGKCEVCNINYPGADSLADVNNKKPEDVENRGNMENVITRKVYEILKELGVTQECECGQDFYKRSPAQKRCGNCSDDSK